ncbi:hypothetical protein MRX96_047409 [Rhipicephalus microplus]
MSGAVVVRKGAWKASAECQNKSVSSTHSTRSIAAFRTAKQHVSTTVQATLDSIEWTTQNALSARLMDTGQSRCLSQLNGVLLVLEDCSAVAIRDQIGWSSGGAQGAWNASNGVPKH